MKKRLSLVLLIATTMAQGQEAEKQRLIQIAKDEANKHIECIAYQAPHQCNSHARCLETRELLSQVADGRTSLSAVNEYTTNKNNCACVRAFVGHDYIVRILDTHDAKPHDERYKGCYGQ